MRTGQFPRRRLAARLAPWWAGMLAMVLATWPAQAQRLPAVLDMAPANSAMVIVVPNAEQFSQKLATLNDTVGWNNALLSNAVGQFRQALGSERGLNEDGAMMLVLLDGRAGADELPALALVLAVSDYEAFVGSFGGNAAEAVAELAMPGGRTGYARKLGNFALVSPRREVVEGYRAANAGAAIATSAGRFAGRTLAGSDAVIYLNVEAMRPELESFIAQQATQRRAAFGEQFKSNPAAAGMAQGSMDVGRAIAQAVVRDARAIVLGLDVGANGVGLTLSAAFREGTMMANAFPGGAESAGQLARLPNEPFMLAAAANLQGTAVKQLLELGLSGLPAEQRDAPGLAPLRQLIPLLQHAQSFTQAYYAPAPGAAATLLNGVTLIETDDPRAYVAAFRAYLESLDNGGAAPDAAATAQPSADSIRYQTAYAPDVLRVEGINVDQYEIRYTIPQPVMQRLGQAGSLLMMLGGGGVSGYLATTERHVLITTATDAQLVRQAIVARQQQQGLGQSPAITPARATLTPAPSVEAYLNVAAIFTTLNHYSQVLNLPPAEVPADLPPVAWSISADNGAAMARLFLPTAVLLHTKEYNDRVERFRKGEEDPDRPPQVTGLPRRDGGPPRPPGPGAAGGIPGGIDMPGGGPMRPGAPGGPGGPMRPGAGAPGAPRYLDHLDGM